MPSEVIICFLDEQSNTIVLQRIVTVLVISQIVFSNVITRNKMYGLRYLGLETADHIHSSAVHSFQLF